MKGKLVVALALALCPVLLPFGKAGSGGNACDLVTKEEVEEVIGQKIDIVEVQPGYGNCIYYTKEKLLNEILKIPVVTVGYTRSDVQERWNSWSSMPKSETIKGLGDGAVWSPTYGFFVCKFKGGLLMISVENKDMAIKLAKKALGRIKP